MADRSLQTEYITKDSWPRRLARPLVALIAPMGISPNQVTVTRFIVGSGACMLLTTGQRPAALWASALWLVSVFLDRVDGELARMTGKTSRLGQRLDFGSDLVLGSLFFVSLGLGIKGRAVWTASIAAAAMFVSQCVAEVIDRAKAESGEKAFPSFVGFDPEDSHAFFVVFVLLDWGTGFLDAAAIGAPLFAAYSLWSLAALGRARAGNER